MNFSSLPIKYIKKIKTMKKYRSFIFLSFISSVSAVICDHPDPLCQNGLPCGPIKNYVDTPYFMACNGNDECDCQPNGEPVLDKKRCKIVPNKLECIECLSGNMENNCNGSLGRCFQKTDGHYRCRARKDSSGVRHCVYEKDNARCFCQPDDPPSSPGNPETCNSDLNICSPDGEEFCSAPGGQCTRTFNPILCSCGIHDFCQETPDGMCGGDLHKCFSDPHGNECVPSSTYWCGLSSEGKCTIERNPGRCEHCEDSCKPNNFFDLTCGGEIEKCSNNDCFCSLSSTGKCNPRYDPSRCSGGPEFCAGSPGSNCGEDINKCFDFDNVCKRISVGGGEIGCSVESGPYLCPAVTCVEGTCNSNNEICQCIEGRCSYIVSDDCQRCLGGTPFSANPCNGGVGKCFDGKECFVKQIGSVETSTQVCAMEETEKCFCSAGAEDSNCFNNLDKCQNGKRCLIDPVTKKCDLQRGHDSFCCLEGTLDNNCNDFENACIDSGRCSIPSMQSSNDKCVIKADSECYQSNFCKGSIVTGKCICSSVSFDTSSVRLPYPDHFPFSLECNGDLGKCSLEGDFGRCEANSSGNCVVLPDDKCCVEGGTPGNNCNNNKDTCLDSKRCSAHSEGFCSLDISLESCFCSGSPSDNCNNQVGSCFNGEITCQISGNRCIKVIDKNKCNAQFCANVGDDCNGNLGYCNISGKKCSKNSLNKCVLDDDITCCEEGTPGGSNKCNSLEGECDGNRKCKASSDGSNSCVLEPDSECICQDIGSNCNGYINKCIPTGGKCQKNSSGACVVNQDIQCCQEGSDSDQCYGNAFTCFKGTNFCVPVGSEGNCGIVQSDTCFCQGDESNNCNNDLSTCYNNLKCELITSGGTKICQTVSSVSCAQVNTIPTAAPIITPTKSPTKPLSPPALTGIIISSSVVALVAGSYFLRRWYVRNKKQDGGEDSFIDE